MSRTYGEYCALARALDHIGDRWTLLIIRQLLLGPARFKDLLSGLPGIATNLLTQRLRSLEADGLVARTHTSPPDRAAAYELTATGQELEEPIFALIRWGRHWMLRGRDGDDFQASWLLLAFRALSQTARPPLPRTTIAVRCHDTTITLHARPNGVTVRDGPPIHPDLIIEGGPEALLGLFAGAIPLEDAIRDPNLDIEGDQDCLRRLLGRLELAERQQLAAKPSAEAKSRDARSTRHA